MLGIFQTRSLTILVANPSRPTTKVGCGYPKLLWLKVERYAALLLDTLKWFTCICTEHEYLNYDFLKRLEQGYLVVSSHVGISSHVESSLIDSPAQRTLFLTRSPALPFQCHRYPPHSSPIHRGSLLLEQDHVGLLGASVPTPPLSNA